MIRLSLAIVVLVLASQCFGVEHVSFKHEGKPRRVSGKVLKEEEGAMLLLATDGVIWNLTSEDVLERKTDDAPFKPLSREDLVKKLQSELPPGTKVHHTAHYLICYNTSEAYAQWCGALYERLYTAFRGYFKTRNWELTEPEFPLVALVFDDKTSYADYARAEIGDGVDSIVAYYNFQKNRVTMYDLTGVGGGAAGAGKTAAIASFLAAPGAAHAVSTTIHEAVHQIAFNCGLHQRFADIPIWLSEGMAVYFETPDLKGKSGWRTIGAFNPVRHTAFLAALKDRPANGLEVLLTQDKRFKDPKTAGGCYGEAWALNMFLFERKNKDYVAYLRLVAEKSPGEIDTPEQRLSDFKSIFGQDLKKFDDEFIKVMRAKKK